MNRLTLPGLATLAVTLLTGVWLIISPFVMQTQPAGKGWTPSTVNDVVLGGLLFVVSGVAILAVLVLGLRGLLQAVTQAERGEPRQTLQATTTR
jgi:hypothetical protein